MTELLWFISSNSCLLCVCCPLAQITPPLPGLSNPPRGPGPGPLDPCPQTRNKYENKMTWQMSWTLAYIYTYIYLYIYIKTNPRGASEAWALTSFVPNPLYRHRISCNWALGNTVFHSTLDTWLYPSAQIPCTSTAYHATGRSKAPNLPHRSHPTFEITCYLPH